MQPLVHTMHSSSGCTHKGLNSFTSSSGGRDIFVCLFVMYMICFSFGIMDFYVNSVIKFIIFFFFLFFHGEVFSFDCIGACGLTCIVKGCGGVVVEHVISDGT